MCASVCSFLDLYSPAGYSGRVFDCSIVSGLMAVSIHNNNCNDGVLSVLVLGQYQSSLLETILCTMTWTASTCVLLFMSENTSYLTCENRAL